MAALAGQDLHLQQLITEALSNTCRKYFSGFKTNLTIAGTIGITVDKSHVCIVHVSDDLLPDTAYITKHFGEHSLDRRPAACANQHACVEAPSDSSNVRTNNTIVIEPSTKKHKQSVQLWDNTHSGRVHMGLSSVEARNTRLPGLIPDNSSLLSLLTSGTKPEDRTVSTEKPLAISAVWGSANKVHVPNRDPLLARCNDTALDLCTGSDRVMRVVPDQLCCASPNVATTMHSCETSAADSNGTSNTGCTSHIDGNTAQFLQQLMRKSATDGVTTRSACLDDIGFASAAKRIKLEAVEMSAKQCNSSPPNSAHVTTSLPSARYDCTESVQTSTTVGSRTAGDEAATQSCTTHAPNTEGRLTQMKPVATTEQAEVNGKSSSAFVDIEAFGSVPSAVKSEGAKAKVLVSTRRSCMSEKGEVDLTKGTAMTMNDLVDFYIRKEIFHNRK